MDTAETRECHLPCRVLRMETSVFDTCAKVYNPAARTAHTNNTKDHALSLQDVDSITHTASAPRGCVPKSMRMLALSKSTIDAEACRALRFELRERQVALICFGQHMQGTRKWGRDHHL